TLYQHDPVFTVENGSELKKMIPEAHCKTLFLKSKKGYFLISVLAYKRIDLKKFAQEHDTGKLSFCNEQELLSLLCLTPGSVTPYGLITKQDAPIIFFLDKDILTHHVVNFHPLQNNMTVGIEIKAFLRFFEIIEKNPHIVIIPTIP